MTRTARLSLSAISVGLAIGLIVMLLWLLPDGKKESMKQEVNDNASTQPSVPAQTEPTTQPVIVHLLDDAVFKHFWIDPASKYTIHDGLLTVHNLSGKGPGFRGLIGGASWDNYRVSLEFRFTDPGNAGFDNKWKSGFPGNVQISPNFCSVFCQVFRGGACNLAYFDTAFHHVDDGAAAVNPTHWNTMSIEVEQGFASMIVNGHPTRSGDIPIGTAGALGLLINFASDATTEIRNVDLTLLNPTTTQLQELQIQAAPGKPLQ